MNEGIHLDLDTWIVPGQIRKANLCRGVGNRYTPAGTEVLISAVAHNTPPPFQAAQNATTVWHIHIYMNKAHFYNLTRFIMGAWKMKVGRISYSSTSYSCKVINQWYCPVCAERNLNIAEDEGHAIFDCPDYNVHR